MSTEHDKKAITKAHEELVRLSEMMMGREADDPLLKDLRRDYKAALKIVTAGKSNEVAFPSKVIAESRRKALEKIVIILDKGDIDSQFSDRSGDYYSEEKFIVTWSGNYNGVPSEYGLDLTDSFFSAVMGPKCIYACRSLVHEKQLAGYPNIEYGLITIGTKLCSSRKKKKEFFEKYAAPYNARLKKKNS